MQPSNQVPSPRCQTLCATQHVRGERSVTMIESFHVFHPDRIDPSNLGGASCMAFSDMWVKEEKQIMVRNEAGKVY